MQMTAKIKKAVSEYRAAVHARDTLGRRAIDYRVLCSAFFFSMQPGGRSTRVHTGFAVIV